MSTIIIAFPPFSAIQAVVPSLDRAKSSAFRSVPWVITSTSPVAVPSETEIGTRANSFWSSCPTTVDHVGYDEAHGVHNQPETSRNPYWGETYQESDYGGVDSAASHNAASYYDGRYDYPRDDTQYEQYQDNGYGYQSPYVDDCDGYDERYDSDQRRFGEFDGMHDNGEAGSHDYSRCQASFGAGASNVSSRFPMDYSGDLLSSSRPREPYPAWASDANVPISKEEVEDIFLDMTAKFGF
ncbi:hypothetical protein BKA56DRAFT_610997 [Ilyonectria sp. MPI-CAGE-AT-0026]|nr:hypothetical protein BKA56DRAFT_610997 [Ilyonectria sp. MPI-CAGE-AT-0026]